MFNKENFVSATFADRDLRYVEVLYNHNKEIHTFVVDLLDTENPDTQRLLNTQDFESIEALTEKTKKEERESFEGLVLELAKRDGLVVDAKELQNKSEIIKEVEVVREPEISSSFKVLFEEHDYDDEKIKEQLFKTKLIAFELDEVKNSKKRKMKSELRTAKTFKEVLEIALKF